MEQDLKRNEARFTTFRQDVSRRIRTIYVCTYHHLVHRIDDIIHLLSRDEAIVIHVVEPKRP